jgi:hypothetical protein
MVKSIIGNACNKEMSPYFSFNKCMCLSTKIDELDDDISIYVIIHISSLDDVIIHL